MMPEGPATWAMATVIARDVDRRGVIVDVRDVLAAMLTCRHDQDDEPCQVVQLIAEKAREQGVRWP